MNSKLSAVVYMEGDWYVSLCPELDIASQGRTTDEAIKNLKEAVELYLEDADVELPRKDPVITTFEVSYEKRTLAVSS